MRNRNNLTLRDLVVVASLCGILAIFAFVSATASGGWFSGSRRAVCMSNLSSINKGLILYRAANDDKYPWLGEKITGWDETKVGTNRNVDPFGKREDPNNPKPRSVTALMFMMVRAGQAAGIFRCPEDANARVDDATKADDDDRDVKEGEYYWDFSKPQNVSYSYQAPRYVNDKTFAQGLDSSETEVVVVADMTPRYGGKKKWTPVALTDETPMADVQKQNSHNHGGEVTNVLYVAGNVKSQKRPDVGVSKDNIFTAFGEDFKDRRSSTSTKLSDHKKIKDTFLIGPVGRYEPGDANSGS